jgi:hypothetical protein
MICLFARAFGWCCGTSRRPSCIPADRPIVEPEAAPCQVQDDEPTMERRASARHLTQQQVRWRPLVDAAGPLAMAAAQDISAEGISLVLPCWVAPGFVLAVTLLDANGDAGIFNLVRVKHIVSLDRKTWSVGGCFLKPLSQQDVQSLLDPPPTDRPKPPDVAIDLQPPEASPSHPAEPQPMTAAMPASAVTGPSRARLPEWRKRQILEEFRERIRARKVQRLTPILSNRKLISEDARRVQPETSRSSPRCRGVSPSG